MKCSPRRLTALLLCRHALDPGAPQVDVVAEAVSGQDRTGDTGNRTFYLFFLSRCFFCLIAFIKILLVFGVDKTVGEQKMRRLIFDLSLPATVEHAPSERAVLEQLGAGEATKSYIYIISASPKFARHVSYPYLSYFLSRNRCVSLS